MTTERPVAGRTPIAQLTEDQVLEPLKRLRVVCEPNEWGLSCDLTWEGAIPAHAEPPPLPEDDPKIRRPDITKARTLLNWEPQVPLEEGIGRTIDPVAMMMFLVWIVSVFPSASATSTFPGPMIFPKPLKTVALFFFFRYVTPAEFLATMSDLYF